MSTSTVYAGDAEAAAAAGLATLELGTASPGGDVTGVELDVAALHGLMARSPATPLQCQELSPAFDWCTPTSGGVAPGTNAGLWVFNLHPVIMVCFM